MKLIIVAFSVIAAVNGIIYEEWRTFKINHKKVYSDITEELKRFGVFKENLRIIQEHNRNFENGKSSFRMSVNQFTDMTQAELMQFLGNQPSINQFLSDKQEHFVSEENFQAPAFVNWTAKGAVTDVIDQGNCASSWSIATVGAVEGQYFLKTGKLIAWSVQNILDCDKLYNGCDGGDMVPAFRFIRDTGIYTEKVYPYKGVTGTCKTNNSAPFLKISSYSVIKERDELELMNAVASIGPVAAQMHVSLAFHFYQSGILDDPFCKYVDYNIPNFIILIVGYGTVNGKDYWLAKSSLGNLWGENGYIKIARNENNMCGIASFAAYPIL